MTVPSDLCHPGLAPRIGRRTLVTRNIQKDPAMTYNATVLIVDDQREVRRLIRLILESAGYTTLEAGSGTEAIETAQSKHPDLVLLDVMMPGTPDGLGALDEIKQGLKLPVKVVLVTAKGQFDDMLEAARLNGDGYVVKPFTRQELLDAVDEALKRPPQTSIAAKSL